MSNSASEEELLTYLPYDKWKASAESIVTQKIAKLTKSESLCRFNQYNPSLTFSQLELRETHLKNVKEKPQKWELVNEKSRFPRMIQTRSLLRDELEILRINLSLHEKVISIRESQILEDARNRENKTKRTRKLMKMMRAVAFVQKLRSSDVRDLLTEIDCSETAKTDKVIWKFIKRGASIRREAINAKKFVLQVQALYLPVLKLWSKSQPQNAQSIKITCPNCRFFVITHAKKISTIRTKLTTIVLAFIRLCIAPYAFYTFSHCVHLCPLCKIYLGFSPAFNIRIRKQKLLEDDHKTLE